MNSNSSGFDVRRMRTMRSNVPSLFSRYFSPPLAYAANSEFRCSVVTNSAPRFDIISSITRSAVAGPFFPIFLVAFNSARYVTESAMSGLSSLFIKSKISMASPGTFSPAQWSMTMFAAAIG